MDDTRIKYKDGGIRERDGYIGNPIWEQPPNDTTYYSETLESQCIIPSRSLSELKKELGIAIPKK